MEEIVNKLQPYAKEIGVALLVVLLAIFLLGTSNCSRPSPARYPHTRRGRAADFRW